MRTRAETITQRYSAHAAILRSTNTLRARFITKRYLTVSALPHPCNDVATSLRLASKTGPSIWRKWRCWVGTKHSDCLPDFATLHAPGAMVDPCHLGATIAPGQPMCCTDQQKRRSGRSGGSGSACPPGAMAAPGAPALLTHRAQRSIRGIGHAAGAGRSAPPGAACRVPLQHDATASRDSVHWHGVATPCQLAVTERYQPDIKAAIRHSATKERLAVWWMAALLASSRWWCP
jgi:hypothetical protein